MPDVGICKDIQIQGKMIGGLKAVCGDDMTTGCIGFDSGVPAVAASEISAFNPADWPLRSQLAEPRVAGYNGLSGT